MKKVTLRFVRLTDDFFVAIPESQFNGLLCTKQMFDGVVVEKMEPLYDYMFNATNGKVAVSEKLWFRMMGHTVNAPVKTRKGKPNFKRHIATSAHVVTKAGGTSGGRFWDDYRDPGYGDVDYSSSEGEEESDGDDDDSGVDSVAEMFGKMNIFGNKRDRLSSMKEEVARLRTHRDDLRRMVVEGGERQRRVEKMEQERQMVLQEEDRRIVEKERETERMVGEYKKMTTDRGWYGTAILTYLFFNATAWTVSLGGWSNVTDSLMVNGVPNVEVATSFFKTPVQYASQMYNDAFVEVPELDSSKSFFDELVTENLLRHDDLVGMSTDDILEIYKGKKVNIEPEVKSKVFKLLHDTIDNLDSEEEQDKLLDYLQWSEATLPSLEKPDMLLRYSKMWHDMSPVNLLHVGSVFVYNTLTLEQCEQFGILVHGLAKFGVEKTAALFTTTIPGKYLQKVELLDGYLSNALPLDVEFLNYVRANVGKLVQMGKRLKNSEEGKAFLHFVKEGVRNRFKQGENRNYEFTTRMLESLLLFTMSGFGTSFYILNPIIKRLTGGRRLARTRWQTVGSYFLHGINFVNLGVMFTLSGLEMMAIAGVINGDYNFDEIVGRVSSTTFYTTAGMQIVVNHAIFEHFSIDDVVVMRYMVNAYSAFSSQLGLYNRARLVNRIAPRVAFYVIGAPVSVYSWIRGMLRPKRKRDALMGDINDYKQRAIANSWTGSSALRSRLRHKPYISTAVRLEDKLHRMSPFLSNLLYFRMTNPPRGYQGSYSIKP